MKKTLLSITLIATLTLQGCSTLNNLIEKPDEDKTVEEFYANATEAFEDKQWESAISNYEKLKAYFPYGRYAEQTHLELAYAYYRYDEPESAIIELNEFIRLYPKHQELPYAYYLKGLAADSVIRSWLDNFITDPATRDVESAKRAFDFYSELLQRFPESRYATMASKRLVILRNQMARHEIYAANFYYQRQAYLAAANRAKYVLENYAQSAASLDALEILKKSYEKLGMAQNYQDALAVYELNQNLTTSATDVGFSEKANASEPQEGTETAPKAKESSWWSGFMQGLSDLIN